MFGQRVNLHGERVISEHRGKVRARQGRVQYGGPVGVDGLGDERGVDQNRRESV